MRLASLTTAEPRRTRQSHGTEGSPPPGARAMDTTSPGTSCSDERVSHRPSRNTATVIAAWPIPRNVRTFLILENAVVASNIISDAALNSAYFQYSSRSHSRVVKIWNTVTGPMSCSLYARQNVGSGTRSELSP